MSASPEISNEDLIALHSQRWTQVHHLDDLDRRSIVLVVTAITGALLAQPSVTSSLSKVQALIGALTVVICMGAIYSTVRNRVSMEYAIATIDYIEGHLNKHQPGLFSYAGEYRPPSSMRSFARRVMFSIRGPIIIFFSITLAYVIGEFVHGPASRIISHLVWSVSLSAFAAILVVISFAWWCLFDNWKRGKAQFEAMRPLNS